jgi:hypothetical protein
VRTLLKRIKPARQAWLLEQARKMEGSSMRKPWIVWTVLLIAWFIFMLSMKVN